MSVRLFIRDNADGTVHEYGTNQHDSLMVMDDGSLHYMNLQNGSGTLFPAEGYTFCFDDGRDPRDPDDYNADPFIDIGGDYWERRWRERETEASGT